MTDLFSELIADEAFLRQGYFRTRAGHSAYVREQKTYRWESQYSKGSVTYWIGELHGNPAAWREDGSHAYGDYALDDRSRDLISPLYEKGKDTT